MKEIFNFIFHTRGSERGIHPPPDMNVYCVKTEFKTYCGRIIYEDDMVIRLRGTRFKLIKILKSNIESIQVLNSDIVRQYKDWLNTNSHVLHSF